MSEREGVGFARLSESYCGTHEHATCPEHSVFRQDVLREHADTWPYVYVPWVFCQDDCPDNLIAIGDGDFVALKRL